MKTAMRILQIGDQDRIDIKKLLNYALEHTLSTAQLKLTMAGDLAPVGDNPDHVIHFHDGYRVVFSYEMQPFGKCSHMSVSVEGDGMPHPKAVEMIMTEFGMGNDIHDCVNVWVENQSVNILQKVED